MAIPIITRSFASAGLSLRKDRIPYTSGLSDVGPGGIRVNKSGETSIPGLYAAGAATDHAEDGVDNIIGHGMESGIGGHRAGEAAAKYAMEIGEPTVYEHLIKSLKEHMFDPMKRQSGLKYQEVMGHCIRIWENGLLGPIRHKRRLEEAIGAAQQIRDEEVPNLVARDYHELARSIGLGNGLLLMELLPRCALLRTESRGSHYREDYPTRDNQDWLKWVIAKKENNAIKVWAEPIPYSQYRLKPKLSK
jgi:succinate dehydrogenase/fumarate reductase flavoprotein subunit